MRSSWQSYLMNALLRLTVKRYTQWRLLNPHALPSMRAQMEKIGTRLVRIKPDVQLTPINAHGVPGEWIAVPESTSQRIILYLHGGGFVFRIPHVHLLSRRRRGKQSKKRLAIQPVLGIIIFYSTASLLT